MKKNDNQMIDMTDKIKGSIEYYVKENLSGSNISFSLFQDGACLFMTWDTDCNPPLFEFREKRHHKTEFYLPNTLKQGIYVTRTAVGRSGKEGAIDIKDSSIQFEINNILSEGSRKSFTRIGLMNFDLQWTDNLHSFKANNIIHRASLSS